MRKLVYAINSTLDGSLDHTNGTPDDELYGFYTEMIRGSDLFIYGRKTYELMVPYWPDVANNPDEPESDREFGRLFSSKKKVVFSRTLEKAAETDTKIFRTGLREEVLKLKQEPGTYILTGGVDIPSQLIALGLVDEIRWVVMPIIVGKGTRLLENASLPEKLKLKLVESKTFKSGSVALRYEKQ